jgi:hypothetical protein
MGDARRPADCGRNLCRVMSKAADKPGIVQLPAEPPMAAAASNRCDAAQRIRERCDGLTSPRQPDRPGRPHVPTEIKAALWHEMIVAVPPGTRDVGASAGR